MGEPRPSLSPFYGLLTRPVQRIRLSAAEPYLWTGARLLDLGCGLTDLPGRLPSYVGCDRDAVVLSEMRHRFPSAPLIAWDVGAEAAPAAVREKGPFDVILMLAILEHLSEPETALRRAGALLSPAGRLVTTTPHPAARLPLELGARLGLLSRHADEEHEDLLGRAELARMGEAAGLTLSVYRRFLLGLNQLAVFARA